MTITWLCTTSLILHPPSPYTYYMHITCWYTCTCTCTLQSRGPLQLHLWIRGHVTLRCMWGRGNWCRRDTRLPPCRFVWYKDRSQASFEGRKWLALSNRRNGQSAYQRNQASWPHEEDPRTSSEVGKMKVNIFMCWVLLCELSAVRINLYLYCTIRYNAWNATTQIYIERPVLMNSYNLFTHIKMSLYGTIVHVPYEYEQLSS